ncbi:hypothetical protein [Microbispora sp. CA-102843]|uniref:hypothetical protein n=1 Tax=Microbispora sp. CA-102843 TaxID=3239952 RepID=UPI003D8B264B
MTRLERVTTLELDAARLYDPKNPISDAERDIICTWMRDNGLDPDFAYRVVVSSNGSQAWADVHEYERTPDGEVVADGFGLAKRQPYRVEVSGMPPLDQP